MTTPARTAPMTARPSPRRCRRCVVAAAAVAVIGALVLAACGDDSNAAQGDTTTAPAAGPATTGSGPDETTGTTVGTGGTAGPARDTVRYEVAAIEYEDVTAPAGGTIEVTNTSQAAHTFTTDDRSIDVAYAVDQPATVRVPTEPGEYPFHCDIHPGMEATLTVD